MPHADASSAVTPDAVNCVASATTPVMNRGVALRFPKLKAWQWIVLAVAALCAAWLGWLVLRHVDWVALLEELKKRPVLFFVALALLPTFGAPMAPFYLGAGAAFPLEVAIPCVLLAMSANIAVSYLFARWLLHPVIERLARRMGYRVPQVRREDVWVITLLLRITPGPPFFMQHYLLALGRVPFDVYMVVSVPVCGLMATAAVCAGSGLTSGSTVQLVAGLFFLVAIILGIRFARKALQRRAHLKVGKHGEIEPDKSENNDGHDTGGDPRK